MKQHSRGYVRSSNQSVIKITPTCDLLSSTKFSRKQETGGHRPPVLVFIFRRSVGRIVAPLQGWTIVIAVTLAVVGLVGLIGGPPQARLVGVLLVQQLVLVLNRSQTPLDLVKLRSCHDILLLGGKNLPNLVLRFLDAVLILWMRIEGLGECAGLLLLHRLDLFKEGNKSGRIVASA